MSLIRRLRNVAWGTVQQWRRGPPPPVEEPDPKPAPPPVEEPPVPGDREPVREPEPTPRKRRL
jgi:hypothetical protein